MTRSKIIGRCDDRAGSANEHPVSHEPTVATAMCRRASRRSTLLVASIALAQSTFAAGADAPAQSSAGESLEEVIVTGRYEFLSVDTSGATNLPVAIEKVPQSISLISEDFLKAADLKTLSDIAGYTPGATDSGSFLGLGTVIKLRGFFPGRAVDGINLQGNTGAASYDGDYSTIDRLEIVKGPSSVVYGSASAGGLVNFVTKSATARTVDYVSAQIGMWNNYRVEGQLSGPIDSEGRVRAIGVAVRDQGDSFMHQMNHAKTTLYGGIDADLSDSISGFLHGGYTRFSRTGFDGMVTQADGTPAPFPRSFFVGAESLEPTTSVYHATGDLTWHATDMLDVSIKGNYETSNTVGVVPYGSGLEANGDMRVAYIEYDENKIDNYGIGASMIYSFDAIGLDNSFVSLAALHQDNHLNASLRAGSGIANIFDGEAALSQAFESLVVQGASSPRISDEFHGKSTTISAQSMVQVLEPLTVLLGASYSEPDATATSGGVTQTFAFDSQMSYRAGLVYEFLPGANAYVSFSEAFNPQSLIDVDGNVLPPLIGEQYEAGIKYRSEGGRLLLTGALFQITQKNEAQFDQVIDGSDRSRPIGEVEHKGFELEALGQITPQWQVHAGYGYLDPKVSQDSDPTVIGQTRLFLPEQTASVYSTFTFEGATLNGLTVGGGARYTSSLRTSFDGSTKDLPAYTVVDASVGYAIDDWLLQLNAHNIFDRHYMINTYETLFYGSVWGEPANVALTVRRNFR